MDIDKIKQFCIFHVEKLIVAIVLAATVFLVYQGLNQPNILDTVQPDRLTADAQQVRAQLDENHNDEIIPERIPNFSIIERTDETLKKVNANLYKLPHTWDIVKSSGLSRRADPPLFRPRAVEVNGVITTLALRTGRGEYKIAELQPADPVERVEPVRRPSTRSKRRAARGGGDDDDGSYDEDESYDDMSMFDPSMLNPSMAGATGPIRKLSADNDRGFRPTTTKNFRNQATEYPVPMLGWFIAGTAVVPHKMIHEAFEHALKEAEGYDYMRRDQPRYSGFELQRADVTDKSVDELEEEDWVARDGRRETTVDALSYWSGVAYELVPEDYRDVALTMWIPPVLLDDYSRFVLHPLVPMIPKRELDAMHNIVEVDAGVKITEEDIFFNEEALGRVQRPQYSYSPTYAYGQPDLNPVEYKLIRFYDFATDPKPDPNSPKPGRKYVYRVRVALNDPNFPSDPQLQPRPTTLHAEAHARVKELSNRWRETGKRNFNRWTDWSEPSSPVSLPSRDEHFVGKIESKGARPVQVGNRTVDFERDPPTAKMVISQFSPEIQTRIPMTVDVTEGSVLSALADFAEVIDPINLEIRKFQHVNDEGEPIPNRKVGVITGTTVIDIEGGRKLDIDPGDKMTEPGYMLMYDPIEGLIVREEIEDQRPYRVYSFADERGEQ